MLIADVISMLQVRYVTGRGIGSDNQRCTGMTIIAEYIYDMVLGKATG